MTAPSADVAAQRRALRAAARSRLRFLCLGAALALAFLAALGPSAEADGQARGWYLGPEGGWSLLGEPKFSDSGANLTFKPNDGFAAGGAFGYDFGRVRLEGEIVYRDHGLKTLGFSNVPPGAQAAFGIPASGSAPLGGDISSLGFMANAIYELFPHSAITPYVGAGIGGADLHLNNVKVGSFQFASGGSLQFAYQAIAGVKVALGRSWSASVDYRYFAATDGSFGDALGNRFKLPYSTQNVMAGVAYHFAPPSPAPPAVPAAVPAPPPPPLQPPSKLFLVFFEFDSSSLTADGARVVEDAAGAFRAGGGARLMVTGYTDLAGSQQYNLDLSKRRAETVRAALVRDGVPAAAISVAWRGKQDPRVPTADGVREPRNRRVEIVMP
ncbi:MAG TPA: OmpA family protein [Stellaceae bacterium]|nr:OmpA family protein [Stellaceae bacterium]